MKKDKFMMQLNQSSQEGGLTCSFNDFQLAEYIQQKRRKVGKLAMTKAVKQVGLQDDGTWVLGPNLYFTPDGQLLDPCHSRYTWISHLYEGPGIALQSDACKVELPLSTDPLCNLVQHLRSTMAHNFFPALLVLGSCAMAMHYDTILSKFLYCPVPLAFSDESGTGKTTALRCGLAITAVYPSRFYSKATLEKYTELCSNSHLPLGIDDPKSRTIISDLIIALFNGAKGATIKRGEVKPSSMAVISANFSTAEQQK